MTPLKRSLALLAVLVLSLVVAVPALGASSVSGSAPAATSAKAKKKKATKKKTKKCTRKVTRTKRGKKRTVRVKTRCKRKTPRKGTPKSGALGGTQAPAAGGQGGAPSNGGGASAPSPSKPDSATDAQGDTAASVLGCDDLDQNACLYPFPSDFHTKADSSSPTGRRVDFKLTAMPRNVAGKPIVPTDWNRADGFSPGSMLITKVPGLDNQQAFDKTGLVPQTDMARSYEEKQPVVVINTKTLERHLIWAELDSQAKEDADRTLVIRPGVNFDEGTRYVVALRDLKDSGGKTIEPNDVFKAFRDKGDLPLQNRLAESRRPHMESIFKTLDRAGVARDDLNLAWDFTVATADNNTGRMLHIRDKTFEALGDTNLADRKVAGHAPEFTIDKVTEENDANIKRTVDGSITVPCWVSTPACAPAKSEFILDPATGKPTQIPGNTMDVKFRCRIPRSATPENPARPSLYGHGLFGTLGEVGAGNVGAMANEQNVMMCATDWTGMSTTDVPTVATILVDLSGFPGLTDRMQQGILNFLVLGRLAVHNEGLSSQEGFKDGAGKPLFDKKELFYDGNSQGGIYGGTLTAVAPDFEKAVLGVPGMNYSTLLTRSVDFGTGKEPTPLGLLPENFDPPSPDPGDVLDDLGLEYAYPLYTAYPKENERPLLFALMQMLWDRSDPNGYAHHMTDDPLPNTPTHDVLMHVALGDHQVAPVTAEVQARTIGAKVMRKPSLDAGRHSDVDPFYKIGTMPSLPYDGSGLVFWDSGSSVPPAANVPPVDGRDPHSHPRNTPRARAQKGAFLSPGGKIIDTCDGGPCRANP